MKHTLLFTLGLIVLGMVAFAALPAEAVIGNGPEYAMPSWDQTIPADKRFVVLKNMNNEAVLDKETGLVWEQSTGSEMYWNYAVSYCQRLTKGGRLGWRLPGIQELQSLVDPSVAFPGPTLPAGHPFQLNNPYYYFWTVTSSLNPIVAFFVNFRFGEIGIFDKGSIPDPAIVAPWCVRGGQSFMDTQ